MEYLNTRKQNTRFYCELVSSYFRENTNKEKHKLIWQQEEKSILIFPRVFILFSWLHDKKLKHWLETDLCAVYVDIVTLSLNLL